MRLALQGPAPVQTKTYSGVKSAQQQRIASCSLYTPRRAHPARLRGLGAAAAVRPGGASSYAASLLPSPHAAPATLRRGFRPGLLVDRHTSALRSALPEWASAMGAAAAAIDTTAAAAAAAATFKMLLLCGVVAFLSHRGKLPAASSRVLSQIAFQISIPCLLLASTARTLSASGSAVATGSGLTAAAAAAVPVFSVLQVAIGALLGRAAARAVEGRSRVAQALFGWGDLHPTPQAAAIAATAAAALGAPMAAPALVPRNHGIPSGLPLLVTLACAFGNCLTLPTLYLSTMLAPGAFDQATAVTALYFAAWSPLLWVAGYGALKRHQAGEEGGSGSGAQRRRRPGRGLWLRFLSWRQQLAAAIRSPTPPPDSAAAAAAAAAAAQGGTVLLTKQLPAGSPGAATKGAAGSGGGSTRPVFVAAEEVEEDYYSPAEALFRRIWRVVTLLVAGPVAAARRAATAVNPPTAAALLGAALGLSPLAPLLLDASAASAAVAAAPAQSAWEVALLLGAARATWELVETLAGAMLGTDMLVFATSLFGRRPLGVTAGEGGAAVDGRGGGGGGGSPGGSSGGSLDEADTGSPGSLTGGGYQVERVGGMTTITVTATPADGSSGRDALVSGSSYGSSIGIGSFGVRLMQRGAASADDASASVAQQLRPHGPWEWRAAVAVAAVRFLLMPAASAALVLGAAHIGLLPRDPVLLFALMLQGAMPPAQALVMMFQLGKDKAAEGLEGGGSRQRDGGALAGAAARLMLQLYAVAAVPMTLWASAFASLAAAAC